VSKVVGDIAVTVGADISHLKRGMRDGSGHVRKFGKDADASSARLAKMGKVAGAAAVAVVTAVGAIAVRGAETARNLENLSRVANTNVEDFQRMALAARTVGIEEEKLSDILKDVNDRVGDFLSTGAGPMADFFEYIAPQVGVTADQFAALSGPDALQLYVSSLEKANLSQQEMTFYLEAMASDTTALLPLLREGGQGLSEFAAEAEALGLILDAETVAGAAAATDAFDDLAAVGSAVAVKVAAGLAPALELVVGHLVNLVNGMSAAAGAVSDFLDPQSELEIVTDNLVAALGDEIQQSQLLETAIGQGTKISLAAAQQKYAEARARHENVRAIIAERRALALGSGEFKTLTADIADAQSALNTMGFPAIDAAVSHRADSFEEQQQHIADLIVQRQELLAVDGEMNDQLERTEENLLAIETALGGAAGGVVNLGGDVVRPIEPSDRRSGGGGGGSSPATQFTPEDFEKLQSDFATELELLEEGYATRQAALEAARAKKLATEAEFNDLEYRMKEEHEAALLDLEQRRRAAMLDGMSGMFGDLSSLMQSENKKLFAVGKAAAIADASIKGYQSAVDAWQKGMSTGGPGLAAAFTAASLAKTGMLISNIASTQHNGGGAQSAASSAAVPAVAETAAPAAQQVNINLGDSMIFPRSAVVSLMEQMSDAMADGATFTVS